MRSALRIYETYLKKKQAYSLNLHSLYILEYFWWAGKNKSCNIVSSCSRMTDGEISSSSFSTEKIITTSSWTRAGNLPAQGAMNFSIGAGLTRLAIGEPSSAWKHWPTHGCCKPASKSSQQICRVPSHLLDWTSAAVTNKYLIVP